MLNVAKAKISKRLYTTATPISPVSRFFEPCENDGGDDQMFKKKEFLKEQRVRERETEREGKLKEGGS